MPAVPATNVVAVIVELLVMIGGPFALAAWAHRRFGVPWRVFLIAAGFYLLNLVVNVPLTRALWPHLFGATTWTTLLLGTVTYGVCEEVARYLSFRAGRTMRANRTPDGALLAGLGHGGTESIVFALPYLSGAIVAIAAPGLMPGMVTLQLAHAPAYVFLVPALERLLAIAAHVGFASLAVLAYRRSIAFLPVAIVAHVAFDAVSMGIHRATGGYWYLLVMLAGAAAAIALQLVLRRRTRSVPLPSATGPDRLTSSSS